MTKRGRCVESKNTITRFIVSPPNIQTNGDPGTADVAPNDAESTQASALQCTPTNCKYDNDKYKLECAECIRLAHYGCTSLPTYQLQLFLTKCYRKFICFKCVEIPSYLHAISLNQDKSEQNKLREELRKLAEQLDKHKKELTKLDKHKENEAHLKIVIKELEGELREQEERFAEVGNPDYDALTKIEGSMKKQIKQLGENLMKNLLNELQDSKREMGEKLNHVMIQTKSYAESVQNSSQEKNQTPNGTNIDFRAIMEETKNAKLVEEKEKRLRSKNFIIHGVEKSPSDNKDDAIKSDDIYINNFIVALKVTSTVKSASRIGLPAQYKNRPIKVVMNTEEERNRILSNLRNLKDIPEYKTISVTEDYTITERRMSKDWPDKVKEKNNNESPDFKFVWRVRGSPKNGL